MSDLVVGLRSVELGVTDLPRAQHFYEQAWGLLPVAHGASGFLFRATGREHHVLRIAMQPAAGLRAVEFAAPDAAAVDRLVQRVRDCGGTVLAAPRAREPGEGGGYAVALAAPDGLRVEVSAGVSAHAQTLDDKTRPIKLTHVVVNSPDVKAQARWFTELLGFRLSDSTRTLEFLRCGADHHSLAIGQGPSSLNHAAFEMADIDGLMYAAGRMLDHGYQVEWGLGRHGPGANVFTYFVDPEGFAIEYTTEMEQVDDSYTVRDAAYWSSFPRRPCRWGVARKPSERLTQAFAGKGLVAVQPDRTASPLIDGASASHGGLNC